MANYKTDLKISILCILTLFGAASLASPSDEQNTDPFFEFKIPDQSPSTSNAHAYIVSPDRVSIAIEDGFPCRLVISIDHVQVTNVPGPMLRSCGVVEDFANQLANLKSDAQSKNRKVAVLSAHSYMGKSLISQSEIENYDTRALMNEFVRLKHENKKLKSALSNVR